MTQIQVDGSTAEPRPGDAVEREILRQVRSLAYGSIEIQVHDARVVQIERRERVRFDGSRRGPARGG